MKLSLIIELTKRDFVERYSGSTLGVMWSFLWPLVNILIYTLVFSKIMGSKLPGNSSTYSYSIYLIAGLIPWTAFSGTISRITNVFLDKQLLIKKIPINLSILPFYIFISEAVTFIITFIIFMIFLVLSSYEFNSYFIIIPLIFLIHQILAYSFGFMCAIFNVFFKDLREIVNILLQIWFWFTPIVYVSEILPDYVKDIMLLNPAFYFVNAYQNIIVYGKLPDFKYLFILILLGHILAIISYLLFKKLEKDLRDFI